MSLEELDRDFARFAVERAETVAPELTWEEPEDLPADADSKAVAGLAREAPQELPGLAAPGGAARDRGEVGPRPKRSWNSSRRSIRNMSGRRTPTCCSPTSTDELSDPAGRAQGPRGAGGARRRRECGLPAADGARRGGRRLARLAGNARRLLAVNPLIPAPYRQLARAAEHLGERDEAVTAYRAVVVARRHRPGRGPLPPGEAPAPGG